MNTDAQNPAIFTTSKYSYLQRTCAQSIIMQIKIVVAVILIGALTSLKFRWRRGSKWQIHQGVYCCYCFMWPFSQKLLSHNHPSLQEQSCSEQHAKRSFWEAQNLKKTVFVLEDKLWKVSSKAFHLEPPLLHIRWVSKWFSESFSVPNTKSKFISA